MSLKIYLIIIISLLRTALGSPMGTISYIAGLNVSYENGLWICGTVECPPETFGCRIQQQSDDNTMKNLNVVYTCFNVEKVGIKSETIKSELPKPRRIDIDIESFVGADSIYSSGYGLGGHENAHGSISPSGWNDFKESAERNKNTVESSFE